MLIEDSINASVIISYTVAFAYYIAKSSHLQMPHQAKDSWYWTHMELRWLISNWNLIPGCPDDEFDALRGKLLNVLQQQHDLDKIVRLLESELIITYGLSLQSDDLEIMAAQVEDWWSDRNSVL